MSLRLIKFFGTGAVFLMIGLAADLAIAQVPPPGTVIEIAPGAPPPPQMEVMPAPPPGPREILWMPGRWRWDGRAWLWVPGHYVERPRHGAHWIAGHWAPGPGGWRWVEGHWR